MNPPGPTVLVLAVGGNVSQGILKALALSSIKCRVIGADVAPLKLGLFTCDRAFISPWATDKNFIPWLCNICVQEKVDAILSGAEPVLSVLAQHADVIKRESGALPFVCSHETFMIGDDKWLTCEWLRHNGFQCPGYALSHERKALDNLAKDHGFPLVAKPRRGGGKRGHIEIREACDLDYVANKNDYLVQQYIGREQQEYTVGCFCDCEGIVRGAISMRRELHEGTTVLAEVGEFPHIRDAAVAIAAKLRPAGPINIQLRDTAQGPVCLELNIRFSGTCPVRARFGFNEVEEALRHFVMKEPARDLPRIHSGIMLRYWNEMYIGPEAVKKLELEGRLEDPSAFPLTVENFGFRS